MLRTGIDTSVLPSLQKIFHNQRQTAYSKMVRQQIYKFKKKTKFKQRKDNRPMTDQQISNKQGFLMVQNAKGLTHP